jgi:hypothetical protein
MSTFSGVVATLQPVAAALTKLARIGVTPTGHVLDEKLLIEVPTLRLDVLGGLARKVVETTDAPAFVLLGQTSADVYVVEEFASSSPTRRLEFNRDEEPQWTYSGAPRPWETDLHFAQPIDELVDDLEDWTDTERDAVRAAYAARDLARLPRLPPLSRRTFVGFTESLGVDLEHPGARWKPPGFFARLFGSLST